MQKDVIDDRYARLYELPNQLAYQGNEVRGVCLSYRIRKQGEFKHFEKENSSLIWNSVNLGAFIFPGLIRFSYSVFFLIRSFKPDAILGSSDCPMVILTGIFARFFNIPCFIDLYDNYESFGLAKIPGVLPLYRWAIKHSTGVSCVSEPLSEHIRQLYGHLNVLTLESTIMGGDFYPQDKQLARTSMALPCGAKIIGVAGSLDYGRGINLLYNSFLELAKKHPDLHLALAGTTDSMSPIPQHSRIHYLGLLPHKDIVSFYNALDLAVICMRNTDFGRYAFPQKTYEILACKTPVLAAKLGALQHTFRDYPQCQYEPDNQNDLEAKIANLLENPVIINIPIPTWQDQVKKLLSWIHQPLPNEVR
jgi:glycosyltransferase involved in cell wall biosynthesis